MLIKVTAVLSLWKVSECFSMKLRWKSVATKIASSDCGASNYRLVPQSITCPVDQRSAPKNYYCTHTCVFAKIPGSSVFLAGYSTAK